VLVWAVENRADWLVADERILRRIAVAERIRVVGFLGLLVAAAQRGILSRSQTRRAIDDAVSKHGCRISIDLYQRLLAELGYGAGAES
jgi:predicted nucleic acid-binding protein